MWEIEPQTAAPWPSARTVMRGALMVAAVAFALAAPPVGASYKVLRTWGSPGTGEGQLEAPLSVSLDGRGSLWVASDRRIIHFSNVGRFIAQWSDLHARDGTRLLGLGDVQSIAADEDGDIWGLDVDSTSHGAHVGVFAPAGWYVGPLNLHQPGGVHRNVLNGRRLPGSLGN